MDFRTNSWYRLVTAASVKDQLSLEGTTKGSNEQENTILSASSNNTSPSQQWQLFPVDAFTFMLRTKASGPNGYLATLPSNNNSRTGDIVPQIDRGLPSNSSRLWRVVPWGDGTFYFSNAQFGKDYHLDFTSLDGVRLSSNTTQPQLGQAFSFVKIGEINDVAFSTADAPTSSSLTYISASMTASTSSTAASGAVNVQDFSTSIISFTTSISSVTSSIVASSTSTYPPQSRALSPPAALGIGVSIGVFGLVSFLALGLFCFQQWSKRRSPEALHYRRARLWKGFTPQTPRPGHISVFESTKQLSDVWVTSLPELPTPSVVLSSPISDRHERHFSWQSWNSGSPPISPFVPMTPSTPPAELPV